VADAPVPPGPAERQPASARRGSAESMLLGGLAGMAAVTAATVGLAAAAAVIAFVVASLT
jgi:hypothetical protein